jgi:ankyrin repeat protein
MTDGLSALHWAVIVNHLEHVKLLLKAGADPSIQDSHVGDNFSLELIRLHILLDNFLIHAGSIMYSNMQGRSVYSYVIHNGSVQVLQAILTFKHV